LTNYWRYVRFASNMVKYGTISREAVRALVVWPRLKSMENYLKNPTEVTRTREGFYIYTNPFDDTISLTIAQTGRFLESEEPLVTTIFNELVDEKSTVIDVGANIGWYTLLAARRAQKVYSFEPDPASLELLKRSILRNGFNNIEMYPCCVSDHTGTAILYLGDSRNLGLHSIVRNVGSKKIEVRSVTIDSIFPTQTIDLMKIDAEGAEQLVMQGASKMISEGRLKHVIMEWNPESWHSLQLLEAFDAFQADKKALFRYPRGVYNKNVFLVAKK
jgi:FkbM family methyltransferase